MDAMISKLRVWPIWKELKHFAISAACEDSFTSVRMVEFCRGLARDLGRSCKVTEEIWLFSQFDIPQLRAIAADEAAMAHLIIISAHHSETLPKGVKSWINQWLGKKTNHSTVLLGLFDPVYQGVSTSMTTYLQDVAKSGDMEFLVKSEDIPDSR